MQYTTMFDLYAVTARRRATTAIQPPKSVFKMQKGVSAKSSIWIYNTFHIHLIII